jgi:hypothetical protein
MRTSAPSASRAFAEIGRRSANRTTALVHLDGAVTCEDKASDTRHEIVRFLFHLNRRKANSEEAVDGHYPYGSASGVHRRCAPA